MESTMLLPTRLSPVEKKPRLRGITSRSPSVSRSECQRATSFYIGTSEGIQLLAQPLR
jgi:hypothetical protein